MGCHESKIENPSSSPDPDVAPEITFTEHDGRMLPSDLKNLISQFLYGNHKVFDGFDWKLATWESVEIKLHRHGFDYLISDAGSKPRALYMGWEEDKTQPDGYRYQLRHVQDLVTGEIDSEWYGPDAVYFDNRTNFLRHCEACLQIKKRFDGKYTNQKLADKKLWQWKKDDNPEIQLNICTRFHKWCEGTKVKSRTIEDDNTKPNYAIISETGCGSKELCIYEGLICKNGKVKINLRDFFDAANSCQKGKGDRITIKCPAEIMYSQSHQDPKSKYHQSYRFGTKIRVTIRRRAQRASVKPTKATLSADDEKGDEPLPSSEAGSPKPSDDQNLPPLDYVPVLD